MRLRRPFVDASVALFPSDHYVNDDPAFMSHVRAAFAAIEKYRHTVVLLGAEASAAETGYGWIEPGDRIGLLPLFRVRRFWEKPTQEVAQVLWKGGCLWNTFVLVARVPTPLALIAAARPKLHQAFDVLNDAIDTPQVHHTIQRLYAGIGPSSFSDEVLSAAPHTLAVLPLSGVEWSDIGEIHRVVPQLAANDSPIAGHLMTQVSHQSEPESEVIQNRE
jgi:mannose-1-phosphate guanylyltransferase